MPLPASEVPAFLAEYGYVACDELTWKSAMPELTIQVVSHTTVRGHTFYHVDSTLRWVPSEDRRTEAMLDDAHTRLASSQIGLRLSHLRAGLHDPIRRALGSSYQTYFSNSPFARKLRPVGTTSRLDAWCRRVAYCIGARLLPPWVAALTLRLLALPVPIHQGRSVNADTASEGTTMTPSEAAMLSIDAIDGGVHDILDTSLPNEHDHSPRVQGDLEARREDCEDIHRGHMPGEVKTAMKRTASASAAAALASGSDSEFDGCPVADLDSDDAGP